MNTPPIRLGVIGSGYMGLTYCESIAQYADGCVLAAVSGGSRAAKLAERYGASFTPEPFDVLTSPDIDAVILATPDHYRRVYAVAAAEGRKHVLAEKPMAPTTADCDAIIAACEAAGVNLAVAQTQRFRDISRRTKHLIDTGEIGPVCMIRTVSAYTRSVTEKLFGERAWMQDRRSGGFFLSMAIHNVDFMRWLTDRNVVSVAASGRTFSGLGVGPLSVMAQIEFQDRIMTQMLISAELPDPNLPNPDFRFEIVGTTGIIDVDNYRYLKIGKNGSWRTLYEPEQFDYLNEPLSPSRLIPHTRVVQDFVDSIRGRRPPAVDGYEGRSAVAAVQACIESARSGGIVQPHGPPGRPV